jgi:hypothetical protein
MFSAQDSIFRVSVGGRREAGTALADDVRVCRAEEILEGLLDDLLGSMFLLLPSGSEVKPVQMPDGRFSAEPNRFSRFEGME